MSDLLIVAPEDAVTIKPGGGGSDGGSGGGSDGSGGGQNQDGNSSSDGSGQSGQAKGGDQQQSQDKNWLEWTVFAIGVAITLGTIGYLIYEVATETGKPPTLEITLTEQRQNGTALSVDVEVENTGDTVAEGAVVEVCGGKDVCAMLNLPYIPAGSTRSGTVGLNLPLTGPLETRAVSFRTP